MAEPSAEPAGEGGLDHSSGPPAGAAIKDNARVMGIADGPFTWEDEDTVVVGVVARLPGHVEAICSTRVHVDGDDATERVAAMVQESGYADQLAALMMKGASLAGFNVLDGSALHSATGVPLITINRQEPDMEEVRATLVKHFDDWERRMALLEAGRPQKVSNGEFQLYCHGHGIIWNGWGSWCVRRRCREPYPSRCGWPA